MVAGLFGLGVFLRLGAEHFQAAAGAKWAFPFVILSVRLTGSFWGVPVFLLFLQFMTYAATIVMASAVGRFREAVIVLVGAHFGAVVLCFMLG